MLGRILRVLFGFVLACLAAGLTLVLFVYTPAELASLNASTAVPRLSEAGLLALAAATHAGVFAAPVALLGAVIGEWRRHRGLGYYALLGIGIAGLGFFLQYRSEAAGDLSILNTYALSAFALTGLIGGLVYWLGAGRHAGGRSRQQAATVSANAAAAPPDPDTPAAAAEAPKA
jgi:hypothetical protein